MVATISRAEVLRRAATIWTPGTVPYSMVTNHQPDGYRQDCSGYVSLCWKLPPPGGSTVTMAPPDPRAVMVPIGEADLKPGDAIGKCGPGTGGANGHIQLFEGRDPDGTGIWIWEQAGGVMGPRRRKVKTVGQGSGFTPWRFTGITDGAIPVEGDDMSVKLINVTKGALKGSVFKVYPTDLGMAYEPLFAELGAAVALWGTQIDVEDPNIFGTPIADLRRMWAAMGGSGSGGGPLAISLTGTATPE